MPTTMLKSSVDVMAPLITRLANVSFSTGVFPSSLKQGRVTPLLKKPGLDQTLLDRITQDFGLCGSAVIWLQSFISDRQQYVVEGAKQSASVNCTSGVPQGSVLCPLLFTMYNSPVGNVAAAHSLRYHQFADDTQLYMAVRPGDDESFGPVSTCVEDVARWFLENGLLLNPTKTEAVLFGTKVQRDKITTASGIDVAGTVVPFRDTVKRLGVTLDSGDGPARHSSHLQL